MIERNTYFYALFLMEAYMNLEKIKKFFGFPLDKNTKKMLKKNSAIIFIIRVKSFA